MRLALKPGVIVRRMEQENHALLLEHHSTNKRSTTSRSDFFQGFLFPTLLFPSFFSEVIKFELLKLSIQSSRHVQVFSELNSVCECYLER